jgi:hypothetical protein
MEREEILRQVEDLTSEKLFDFICQGKLTLDELRETGNLDASKRRAILVLQKERELVEDITWESLRSTEEGCRTYLEQFSAGKYISEAKMLIEKWKKERERIEKEREELLNKFRSNPNSFQPYEVKTLLKDGAISREDLIIAGIPVDIIDNLNNVRTPSLNMGKTPDSIPEGYTEVYFWGIPGSGKTCVLSSILSTADEKGYLEIATGPGYDYMTHLKNIFRNPVSFLPPPSAVDSTQYLPFALKKNNDNPRSVSLIELSGEVFQCFFYKNASLEMPTPQHEETLNKLLNFLDGNNRKIHFFFIDYQKENNLDTDGYTQADYLQAAATYFQNNDIFKNSTDAIYIVITKSDLMKQEDKLNHLNDYLLDNRYTAFIESLKTRCKEHCINSGELLATHFSLGNVYFNQICSFDDDTSKNIIDILVRRIKPNKKSILDVFNK